MATTALLPIDPASSPQQISRVLSIRANLLPAEVTAGRNARRMRVYVIVALVLVAALLGTWYAHAISEKSQAVDELAAVSKQVDQVRDSQGKDSEAATVKKQNETVTTQLKTLLAQDLPWAALTDEVRATGTKAGVTVSAITGALTDPASTTAALPTTTSTTTVASLQINGTGKDKKTVAGYVDALGDLPDLANPYLTSAAQTEDGVSFTLSAEVTSAALCGHFTAECPTGGK
ncbi:PilN domain-containing protein [Micromonosporaceae bacterium Da 78-11]